MGWSAALVAALPPWGWAWLSIQFHVLNAYDDGPNVVIDVVRYDRLFADDHTGPTDADPILTRWTVDLTTSSVSTRIIDDRPQEFPRVADRTVGTRHRYGYAVTEHDVVQRDLDRGTTVVHPLGENSQASEALFVPAADETADNEGWVVAIVHHNPQPDEFLVLDATALDHPPHCSSPPTLPVRSRVPSKALGGQSARACLGRLLDGGEGACHARFELRLAVAEDQALDEADQPWRPEGLERLGHRGRPVPVEAVAPSC